MNRIDKLFQRRKQNVLSIFFTAGYPELNDTVTIIKELERGGADMIEIGFPFSDPIADGPVIQRSNEIAISNGMNLKTLFGQIENIRENVTIPLLLMGYLNPVMQYGIENFCRDAAAAGIDGLIIPDMSFEIYMKEYKQVFERYNLHYIPMITPHTSEERIRKIDSSVSGFIYIVSTASTTGTKSVNRELLSEFMGRVKKSEMRTPQLIGFGINDRSSFENVCRYADGGIIGTAFIKSLSGDGTLCERIDRFMKSIK